MGKALEEFDLKIAEKIFYDGWNDSNCLDYLAQDDIDSYEKFYSFDCRKMCIRFFRHMEKYDIHTDWLHDVIYPILPTTDKEIDYFLSHNNTWAIIINSCRVSVDEHQKTRLKEIEEEQQQIRDEVAQEIQNRMDWINEHMGLLKEWEDPRANELARESIDMIAPFIKKNPKHQKKTRNPLIVQRNEDIRKEYYAMEEEDKYSSKYIRKTLAEKYDIEKPDYIKDILSKPHL